MRLEKVRGYNNIYAVDAFFKEYEELFGKNKKAVQQHYRMLHTKLYVLDDEWRRALQYKIFEKLEGCPFYAIRQLTKLNPRIIFAYRDTTGQFFLLSCCKEKKRSDYDRAIERAYHRISLLEVEE